MRDGAAKVGRQGAKIKKESRKEKQRASGRRKEKARERDIGNINILKFKY